jgi:hypothetical protein
MRQPRINFVFHGSLDGYFYGGESDWQTLMARYAFVRTAPHTGASASAFLRGLCGAANAAGRPKAACHPIGIALSSIQTTAAATVLHRRADIDISIPERSEQVRFKIGKLFEDCFGVRAVTTKH